MRTKIKIQQKNDIIQKAIKGLEKNEVGQMVKAALKKIQGL